MKRLLILLLLFPAFLQAQNIYPIRGINRTVYGADTMDIRFSADSTKLVTNNKFFVFNKRAKVNKDTLAYLSEARSLAASGGLTFVDDILDFQTNKYTYYPDSTGTGSKGGIYLGTQSPTKTTRVNWNRRLYTTGLNTGSVNATGLFATSTSSYSLITESLSGSGGLIKSTGNGNTLSVLQTGTADATGSVLILQRDISGTANISGAYININDVPTTTGTNTGKALSYIAGSTERISLNPRVVDGASAVGYLFDTETNLVTNGAKLVSFKNSGTEKMYIGKDGDIVIGSVSDNMSLLSNMLSIRGSSITRTLLNPKVSNGGSAIAYTFDTDNSLSTAGAKIATFKNAGTEKAHIDKDGILHSQMPHVALYRNTDLTIAALQNVWYKLTGMTAKDADYVTYQGDSIRLDHAGSYLVNMNISFSGSNNEIWELGIFKNSVLEEPSQLRYTSTADVGNMSCPVYVYSDGNDWVSFKIRNTTDGDDPTLKRISIVFTPMHLNL